MFRIRSPLLATIAVFAIVIPASADLTGITASPIKLPATLYDLALGPDGNLWGVTTKGNLGKVTPSGAYSEVTLWGTDQFNIPYAQHLTAGSDGNLWVLGLNGHVDRVSPGGTVTDFTAVSGNLIISSMVSRADGTLWFFNRLSPGPGTIGSPAWKMTRIDVLGHVTTYDLGISGDSLAGLVSGGDGNLWFIDETKSQLVKFSPGTNGVAGTFAIPSPNNQSGDDEATVAWDGNVWFTRGTSIDRATADGKITEFHIPSGGQPAGILMAGDGNIWFSEPSSGKVGQLVLSSVTAGGAATINESSSGVLPGVYSDFLLLPPAFSGSFAAATTLALAPKGTCPPLTFLAKNSDSGQDSTLVFPIPQCADIAVGLPVARLRGASGLRITSRIGNNGPNKANAFMIFATASFSTTAIAAATFDNFPAARCDLNQPQPGAVECSVPLNAGEAHDLHVDFNNLTSPSQVAIFTRITGFSDLPDPDPSNNVQVRFVILQSVAALPPANSGSGGGGGGVANPPIPPGFKPCMVNAGSVGAVGPCFGPSGTTITLLMSQTVPGGPGSLVFKSVVFSGGPADVSVPVTGSGSVYSATAPPTLCAGPFPHAWNVWLVDKTGGSQGEIGQFTMTTCP